MTPRPVLGHEYWYTSMQHQMQARKILNNIFSTFHRHHLHPHHERSVHRGSIPFYIHLNFLSLPPHSYSSDLPRSQSYSRVRGAQCVHRWGDCNWNCGPSIGSLTIIPLTTLGSLAQPWPCPNFFRIFSPQLPAQQEGNTIHEWYSVNFP